jgi:hypothetical protein
MVRSEGNMSLKNPVTPPGIDPAIVRLVAQRLNHYATPGPKISQSRKLNKVVFYQKTRVKHILPSFNKILIQATSICV